MGVGVGVGVGVGNRAADIPVECNDWVGVGIGCVFGGALRSKENDSLSPEESEK